LIWVSVGCTSFFIVILSTIKDSMVREDHAGSRQDSLSNVCSQLASAIVFF
jgi:hypothetical protein